MSRPELIDEPELVQALARLVAPMDLATTRAVIAIVDAAYDAGYATALVRRFTPSDTARANLTAALAVLPKELK